MDLSDTDMSDAVVGEKVVTDTVAGADADADADTQKNKYRPHTASDASDMFDEMKSAPDSLTYMFIVMLLVILMTLYTIFFGSLLAESMRTEL